MGPAYATDDGDCFWRRTSGVKAGGFACCGRSALHFCEAPHLRSSHLRSSVPHPTRLKEETKSAPRCGLGIQVEQRMFYDANAIPMVLDSFSVGEPRQIIHIFGQKALLLSSRACGGVLHLAQSTQATCVQLEFSLPIRDAWSVEGACSSLSSGSLGPLHTSMKCKLPATLRYPGLVCGRGRFRDPAGLRRPQHPCHLVPGTRAVLPLFCKPDTRKIQNHAL